MYDQGHDPSSMEGRAIARPNRAVGELWVHGHGSSMEGRAIARPNTGAGCRHSRRSTLFNGGPGNCPAKRLTLSEGCGREVLSSMEGRAIARPNCRAAPPAECPPPLFNGGPGNCPAKQR